MPTSWMTQMCGWSSADAARASQELDRHAAPELEILGLVDHAHAAAAELREDPVARDGGADH
jgi:hypothetical protein